MADKQLVNLSEALTSADDDIYHLQTIGGFNKKITKANILSDIQAEVDTNTSLTTTHDVDINNLKGLNPSNQTNVSYTLVLADADAREVWMNNAGANTLTVPLNVTEAIPIGSSIIVMQEGAGTTTIQAVVGVQINGVDGGSTDINAQYTGATLTKRDSDVWVITGNISGVV